MLQPRGRSYLEVGIQEIETEKDGNERWERQGGHNSHQTNCRQQAKEAAEPECREVCNVSVDIRCILGEPIDDPALRCCVEE